MHGVVAKRRVAHLGLNYDYETFRVTPGPPVPEFLLPLQRSVADLTQREPEDFREVLVTEYPAGAGIGWHRDAPAFEIIVGASLLGALPDVSAADGRNGPGKQRRHHAGTALSLRSQWKREK